MGCGVSFSVGYPGTRVLYTLYPITGDVLAVQVIVTEWSLPGGLCSGLSSSLRSLPLPEERTAIAKTSEK